MMHQHQICGRWPVVCRVGVGVGVGRGGGGYSSWFSFDGDASQINDDPAREDWNVDQWVDKFVQDAK